MSIIAASQEALSICTTFGGYMNCCNKIAGINLLMLHLRRHSPNKPVY